MDVRGVGENPEGKAVRPLLRSSENQARIDAVAVEKFEQDADDKFGVEVEGEQGDDDEEGQQPKVIKSPKAPTKTDREEHEATHLPFRSWCTYCLRGRGRNKPHQRQMITEYRRSQWITSL